MCPSWKEEEEAPNPHKKEELLLAPERGDQDLQLVKLFFKLHASDISKLVFRLAGAEPLP